MKNIQKQMKICISAIILLLVMALTCGTASAANAKSLKLSKKKAILTVGQTLKLKATVKPKKAKVTWSSDKRKVATVSKKGVVKAKKKGKATITAKSGKKKATCKITVVKSGIIIGDVVIGSKNRLFSAPEIITDYEKWKQEAVASAKLINKQAEEVTKNGAVFIYINYPKKNVVETKYLPDFYPDERKDYQTFIQIMRENLSDKVIFIDAYDIFTSQEKYDCYFITDHHANVRGQQMIYKKVMSIIRKQYPDIEIKTLKDYKIKKQKMSGSFNRRIGNIISAEKEELNLTPNGWKLEYERNSKVEIFGKKNTYANAFMGGDYAYTKITTKKKNAPSVLFCGSSFTNALEALVVPSVSEMISLDYRHNNDKETLAEKAKEYGSDYVIFIPNQSDAHFSYKMVKKHLGIK